ncbi:MAG: MATE family efflux transporter [Clostridia bacterium]|nr:MATE family efflux transporter [Clostridia bacterium]
MNKKASVGRYQIDMCSGPILSKLLQLALPLMFSNILQLLFSAADSIVVGRFAGDSSLAAVGATVSLISLITNLFLGLSIGSNVVAARDFGLKDNAALSRTVHTSMALSLIVGSLLTIVGFTGSRTFLIWMQTPEEILDKAAVYLRIYFLGMIPMTIYNYGSALLRAVGDTRRPFIFLLASGVINVILNLIFVICFHLDVVGVASSTVISQAISMVLILRCLMREPNAIRFIPKQIGISRDKLTQILKVGLPAGLQSSMFSISNTVIQSAINIFGESVIAANAAAVNFEDMIYFAINAIQQAITSFTGQNAGPRNYKRIRRVMLIGLFCAVATAALMGGVEYLLADHLLGIYSESAEVIAVGVKRLRFVVSFYYLCGIMECFVGGLRGLGSSVLPTVISVLGICCFRLVWLATIFQIEQYHTIEMVYILYPITWVITSAAEGICFVLVLRHRKKHMPPDHPELLPD